MSNLKRNGALAARLEGNRKSEIDTPSAAQKSATKRGSRPLKVTRKGKLAHRRPATEPQRLERSIAHLRPFEAPKFDDSSCPHSQNHRNRTFRPARPEAISLHLASERYSPGPDRHQPRIVPPAPALVERFKPMEPFQSTAGIVVGDGGWTTLDA